MKMSDRKCETRRRQDATRSGSKALKLIQPVSKRDQVVAAFKDAILRGEIRKEKNYEKLLASPAPPCAQIDETTRGYLDRCCDAGVGRWFHASRAHDRPA